MIRRCTITWLCHWIPNPIRILLHVIPWIYLACRLIIIRLGLHISHSILSSSVWILQHFLKTCWYLVVVVVCNLSRLDHSGLNNFLLFVFHFIHLSLVLVDHNYADDDDAEADSDSLSVVERWLWNRSVGGVGVVVSQVVIEVPAISIVVGLHI